MLLITVSISSQQDLDELTDLLKRRQMSLAYSKSNTHVFLPSADVKIVT